MSGRRRLVVFAVVVAVACAGAATASQQRPYRTSDQQLKDLVNRIGTHRDAFHRSFDRAMDRSPINGVPAGDEARRSVRSLDQALDLLRDRVNDGHSDAADADDVLTRATVVDRFMVRNQLDAPADTDWQALRLDMNDLARAYGITRNWSAVSNRVSARADDDRVEELLKQIGKKAGGFDKSLNGAFNRSQVGNREKDAIRQSLKDLEKAADRLRDRVKGRQSNTVDVEEVLRRGLSLDGFMQRYQLSAEAEQGWLSLRGNLDSLARAYNVPWNWSSAGNYTPAVQGGGFHHRLTGTYRLENGSGADPRRAAELAARAAPSDQRQRTYQNLLARLDAPELLAIERFENSVTMASTRGARVTVEADGRDQVELWSGGRSVTTRATLHGERLVVSTNGSGDRDYTVTFDPTEDGRTLQMTRNIADESLRQPVTVRSSYRRVSDQARWDMDPGGRGLRDDDSGYPGRDAAVPDGTRFVAVLDNALSTSTAREGDLYTMTARTPASYEGAVIQGLVSSVNESGRLTGRAGLSLNMQSIRLRDGRWYPFDGVIENLRTPDGDTVRVDREGTIDADGSQTRKTVQRGAIGAALGALVGAITGGGKGAAIGAVIGAGGGAGTVIVQGRDRLELQRGTEMTITAGDPGQLGAPPGVQR